jgi:alkylation response protein AidB-like acyl-CoA dehydrogenase
VKSESIGLLRQRDPVERVVVPELQCEAHLNDPTGVSTSLFPPAFLERRTQYRAFMDEHVYPNEGLLDREDDAAHELVMSLQAKARTTGLWAPHMPPSAGGTGDGFLYYACVNEEIGRSHWAQLVFGCQAPDAGNAEILHHLGTPEQKDQFLEPLVAGRARSFFSMTEPDVAGSDPTLLRTRAVLDGDAWVIDGRKWFSSGADGAAFGIVFAITDPDAETYKRGSMILVPTDTPGLEIEQPTSVLGHVGRSWNTHCEVRYAGVRVPVANTLGERGEAFRIAQKRLGPGRIHHVMRWLGQMQRAFDLMCSHALEREAFGGPLAEKQTVQNWIADSAAGIQACRLLTMDAARRIDEASEARVEVSLLKFYAAGVLNEVIDRAIQVHGARGLTDATPLAQMARHARAGRIYDGPDEVHRMVVARRILKSYAAGDLWRFS